MCMGGSGSERTKKTLRKAAHRHEALVLPEACRLSILAGRLPIRAVYGTCTTCASVLWP